MSSARRQENGRLPKRTLRWALRSIVEHGSNSLYRNPFEIEVFDAHAKVLTRDLSELRVDQFRWSQPRRMVIPKDQLSFRLATQLDPVDDLILLSIAKRIGKRVESRRIADDIAYSHRFVDRGPILYRRRNGFKEFWQRSKVLADGARFVVRTDISDFYSQVPHSEIASQLQLCEVPERLGGAIERFLGVFGGRHPRGIPIGPHAAHLLAELCLIRADNLLESMGHEFVRYVDDYHLFCSDEKSAYLALYDLAELLRIEFGLALNRGKTRVQSASDFITKAKDVTREESPEAREEALLEVIEELTEDEDPYQSIDLDTAYELAPEAFSKEALGELLDRQLVENRVDYQHLAWLLRRLAQIGPPNGIPYVLENFEKFVPVVGDAANYLERAGENWDRGWEDLGENILHHAEGPVANRSSYLQMVLYGLFGRKPDLDHFSVLARRFGRLREPAKREVLLAARAAQSGDWLHSIRKRARNFDPWTRRAYVHAIGILPAKQQEECVREVRAQEQTTDSVLLGAMLAERSTLDRGMAREPSGPGWAALRQMVATERRRLVTSRMAALENTLQSQIYRGSRKNRLLVATWNLRNLGGAGFGFGERLQESLLFISRILLGFDLIALQEVQNKESLKTILNLLGKGWSKLICGEAVGKAGNQEMSAFVYRNKLVEFDGEVEQIFLPKSRLIQKTEQFARPPFIADFKVGGCRVTACSAHIYFGATRGAKYDRRLAEIRTLVKRVLARADAEASSALLLGDLNVVGPEDPTMEALKKAGISLRKEYLQPTNATRDKFYTQIAFRPTQEGPRLKRAGVFPVFDLVFRESDRDRYEQEMQASKAWETSNKRGRDVDPADFYRKWRTYQMSDHLPVWAEFSF